ncbi:ATP-dependent DNA helicase PIF1-like [Mercenaria mercenaria]|uniref:ATP-dependent DNA helicase PIF1-like n=1 Tax=Mercenaria mercenaria TaxID=6596 RepID=UPI00234E7722|nr:ATP-dependent DNA helicase PIF1-like [Mercenaria mercenaria]
MGSKEEEITLTTNKKTYETDSTSNRQNKTDRKPVENRGAALVRLKRPLPKDAYSDCVKLFSRNDQVDDFNRQSIVEFPGQLYEFKSDDEGDLKYLNKILAPETLWLKIAAPVILLRNLSDRLVNGLRGNIYDITDSGPIVEFPSLNLKMPLEKVRFSVFSPTRNTEIAVRMQYPVKLSFAMSIHKSQGLTIDCLEVDCRNIFKPGQLGVALGRARSSKGLRVINFKPQLCVIQQPEVVRNFLSRDSTELLEDKTCCSQKLESSEQRLVQTAHCQSTEKTEEKLQETEQDIPIDLYEDDAEEFDKEFDDIISMITVAQSEPVTLPSDLNLDLILSSLKCENVKTIMQENTN